jgi:hypothetical protein
MTAISLNCLPKLTHTSACIASPFGEDKISFEHSSGAAVASESLLGQQHQ